MQRNLGAVLYSENTEAGYAPGDQYARAAAAALAVRADAPTIVKLTDILTLLEDVGGQVYITGLRIERPDGRFTFDGFGAKYESVDARMRPAKPPESVEIGPIEVPISDMQEPAPETDLPEPPEPEGDDPDHDVRDEIEDEIDRAERGEPALTE
jgi:hypothetical protein